MLPTEGNQFRNVIVGMGRMYGQELDKPVLDAYWIALCDWPLQDFEAAARRLMQTTKFMPRPADFHDLRKAGRPTAGEAWAQILASARTGDEQSNIGAAARKALAAIGGIRVVMMSDTDKTPFLERRFAEHFEVIEDAQDTREAVPQITSGSHRLNGPQPMGALLGSYRTHGR